jgi:hypothetical protein
MTTGFSLFPLLKHLKHTPPDVKCQQFAGIKRGRIRKAARNESQNMPVKAMCANLLEVEAFNGYKNSYQIQWLGIIPE